MTNFIKELKLLESYIQQIQEQLIYIFSSDEGRMFQKDFLAIGCAQRGISTISGFITLINTKNYLCAFSLVRIHLDTLLQYYSSWLVENPHIYAEKVLKGKRPKDIKDKLGNKMTDGYLVKIFFENNEEYLKLKNVYTETSGFIHFSNKHIFSAFKDIKGNKFSLKISSDANVEEKEILESIECMILITQGILKYLYSRGYTKEIIGKKRY